MSLGNETETSALLDIPKLSEGERSELIKLGVLNKKGEIQEYELPRSPKTQMIKKRAIHAPQVLNEAFSYSPRPSSFSRALSLELGGHSILLVSGTASVDEMGKSIHAGDFRAQCWRTYRNITELLKTEKMTWHDVVRTTCYLRDITRDYKDFNEVRTAFFTWLGLDPLPASTGIQAHICRDDLLVEIEAIAVRKSV